MMMISDPTVEELPFPSDAAPGAAEADSIGSKVTDMEQQARRLIRQRPVVAVLAALGAGYLAARLVSRALR
jgi:hypothetical protein